MYSEVGSTKRRHQMYYDVYHTEGWVDTPDGTWPWRIGRSAFVGGLAMAGQKFSEVCLTSYKHIRTKYHAPLNLG